MSASPDVASRRYLERILRRTGLSADSPPADDRWAAFLDATRSLLANLVQDRYLLERSLETSSVEMVSLNDELRAAADRLEAEREDLRRANSLLAATLESTAEGILVADGNGGISSFNGRFAELWGIPSDALDTMDDSEALASVLDQLAEPEAFLAKVAEQYQAPDAASHDTLTFKDGRVFERVSFPQRIEGKIVGRVWSFRDVTEQRRLQSELVHQAFHDPLTNLANRALFDDHVQQALRRQTRTSGHLAVIVVDLDGFKTINDSLGHQAGDALLIAVAERFRGTLRDFDTLARLGGDEFAMLVDDLDQPDEGTRIGQRILNALVSPINLGDRAVSVGASIGIAIAGDTDTSADKLLGNADAAMYRAKRDGKRCARVFEPWMHVAAVERLDLELALRDATAQRRITVEYQPVVSVDTGRVVCFEALARWTAPGGVCVPPAVFIPLAEEIGLILDLGREVLNEACRQAQLWQTRYAHLAPGVAVNVSSLQLASPAFLDDLIVALEASRLDPCLLTLEITESAIGASPGRATAILERVREMGVRVAIDDFGTGYSSFAALVELPVDTLKIDKRFIDNLLGERGRGLVKAITQLARVLELSTTAEGVEQPDQREVLRELGCQHLQGYLFSPAMTPDQAERYLDAFTIEAYAVN